MQLCVARAAGLRVLTLGGAIRTIPPLFLQYKSNTKAALRSNENL